MVPGEEPPRELRAEAAGKVVAVMANTGKNRRRHVFSTAGVDFSDDTSLREFAARVWQAVVDAEKGEHVTKEKQAPSVVLTGRYAAAVAYASSWHAGQTRKGNDLPYICHPLGVSSLVLEAGGSEDEAIAGLLHDVAEDCGGEPRLAEISTLFGAEVERIVRACSDSITKDRDDKAPWEVRKNAHLAHLATADPSVVLVTAADKLHNARSLVTDIEREGLATLGRFNASPVQTAWYYREMLRVLETQGAPAVLLVQFRDLVRILDEAISAA